MLPVRQHLQSLLQQPTELKEQTPQTWHAYGIKSGYRQRGKSWGYYLISIFQVHNETGNIWTHGLAVPVYLLCFSSSARDIDINDPGYIGMYFLCFGLVFSAVCSSIAYTFNAKSQLFYYICYMIDYMGIAIHKVLD